MQLVLVDRYHYKVTDNCNFRVQNSQISQEICNCNNNVKFTQI